MGLSNAYDGNERQAPRTERKDGKDAGLLGEGLREELIGEAGSDRTYSDRCGNSAGFSAWDWRPGKDPI